MFMDKNELENIKALTKVKLRNSKRVFLWSGLIAMFMYVINLASNLLMIYKTEASVVSITVLDFSTIFMVYFMILLLNYQITYRQTNDLYAVYPQTNTSRFLSSLLYQNVMMTSLGIFNLVLYLLEYTLFRLLSSFKSNIVIMQESNLSFLLIGFLTFLVYAYIAASFMFFLGALLRKIGYFAIPVVVALLSFFVANLPWSTKLARKILAFLTGEASIPLFFVKCFLLWILCTGGAILINKYTVYQTTKRKLSLGFAAVCTGIALLVVIVSVALSYTIVENNTSSSLTYSNSSDRFFDTLLEIPVDVSKIPKGSELKIVRSDNLLIPDNNYNVKRNNNAIYYTGAESIVINSDMLYVYYHNPVYAINGNNLVDYTKPSITAVLKDDTLILDYTYITNQKIVILPVWGVAVQFSCYDKHVASNGFTNSYTYGPGSIMITSEKMNLN